MQIFQIDTQDIPQLSKKDVAYIKGNDALAPFQQYRFDFTSFGQLIDNRRNFKCNRPLLTEVLQDQYKTVETSDLTQENIKALAEENSFTVTTAHQPVLMTGPLYYCFKILSAIHLTRRLGQQYPHRQFIPVFVIGGEDHDFEEINHFHLFRKRLEWEIEAGGPVGRLPLEGLDEIIKETADILGPRSQIKDLIARFSQLLKESKDYGDFSFRLVHLLFDKYGLVILRMDDGRLKKEFIPLIKDEILNETSRPIVNKTQEQLQKAGFDSQAYAREINFFYTGPKFRNRIIKEGDNYKVLDTDISFTQKELINDIEAHPENYSPNVIMRPLYQELILPNLAFVGGGGEISYWLERKEQFEHFGIHFPMLIRRVSGMIIDEKWLENIRQLGLEIKDLFREKADLVKHYLEVSEAPDYKLSAYRSKMDNIFSEIADYIGNIDKTLETTTRSEATKLQKSISYLEGKLKKSIKQAEETRLRRIDKWRERILPFGKLQERNDNIFEYLSIYGADLLDEILPYCDPFDKSFKVFMPGHPLS